MLNSHGLPARRHAPQVFFCVHWSPSQQVPAPAHVPPSPTQGVLSQIPWLGSQTLLQQSPFFAQAEPKVPQTAAFGGKPQMAVRASQ